MEVGLHIDVCIRGRPVVELHAPALLPTCVEPSEPTKWVTWWFLRALENAVKATGFLHTTNIQTTISLLSSPQTIHCTG